MKNVKKRMQDFKKDLLKWKEYDYVVINDDLNICYKKIMRIIKRKNNIKSDNKFISLHVKSLLV